MELEDVFRAHQQAVFAYFVRVIGNRQDAEELTQETFVRACSAAIRFRRNSSVKTWLFGIARRVLLEASRAGLFDRTEQLADVAAARDWADVRIDLERTLATLGISDREALVMVDVLGFEPREAAAVVGSPPRASVSASIVRDDASVKRTAMYDEQPIDLRSLAAVDSPDAIRSALREFWRRTLTKYIWVAIGVAVLIVAAFVYPPERSLVARIETADERVLVGYSVEVGGATWTLLRVADLGDSLGLEWLVWPAGPRGRLSFPTVAFAGVSSDGGGEGTLVPFEVEPPADGILKGTIRTPGSRPEPFSLDLRDLGVPARYWEPS